MDGGSVLPILKILVPQIPSLSYTAVQHTFGFSETSSKWDLRTAMTVNVLRGIMNADGKRSPPPVGRVQKRTLFDAGVKGKIWVAKTTIPKPPTEEGSSGVLDMRGAVFKAVEDMKTSGTELNYTKPVLTDLEVEWTGYRPGAAKDEPMPNVSEAEKFKLMMADTTSEVTVLYFHGGAYYLCDPSTHRAPVSRLAKESGGRVCSVRYRLAPQTAFPGQLLDAFMVYLSLLYPPADSLLEAVPAEKIVLGGDSAGGNLSFALLQLLLQLHRSSAGVPVVKFHGRDVHVPLPAGASANSGWFDVSRSMPSIESNAKWDYLPFANHDTYAKFPKDDIWPTDPPRGDLFCDLSLLDHPLVSQHIAESWKDSCPLWMCVGDEMLADEINLVASTAAKQGVKVQLEQYEAMPHCFQMLMAFLATADRCMTSWGQWARRCVEEPGKLETNGTFIPAKKGPEAETKVDVQTMKTVPMEEAKRRIKDAKERRLKGYDMEGNTLTKPAL